VTNITVTERNNAKKISTLIYHGLFLTLLVNNNKRATIVEIVAAIIPTTMQTNNPYDIATPFTV